ncbi:MAG: 2-dehydropantoate 2-reductase N-terminal domain-containing protein, partial [Bacteroidota bacterium]
MNFLVFGTGGVGGYFGAMLARAGEDVWFVARGKHLEAMLRSGFRLKATKSYFTVPTGKMSEDPADGGEAPRRWLAGGSAD